MDATTYRPMSALRILHAVKYLISLLIYKAAGVATIRVNGVTFATLSKAKHDLKLLLGLSQLPPPPCLSGGHHLSHVGLLPFKLFRVRRLQASCATVCLLLAS